MYPAVVRVLIRFSRAAVLDAGVFMLYAGAAAGDAGIALRGFMYPAIGGAFSRLSVAAALDTGILGSECTDTQMQAVSVTSIAQRMLFQIVFSW